MKKFVFIKCFIISLICIITLSISFSFTLQQSKEIDEINTMTTLLTALNKTYTFSDNYEEDVLNIASINENYRVTLISDSGEVLADSEADIEKLENHNARPEVVMAREEGISEYIRNSDTVAANVLYCAILLENDNVLRVMIPMTSIYMNFFIQFPIIFATVIVALIIASIMSTTSSKAVIKPLNDIISNIKEIENKDFNGSIKTNSFSEYTPLINSINNLSTTVKSNINELEYEKDKLHFFLESIIQGVIIIDENLNIIHLNKMAKIYFHSEENPSFDKLIKITHNEKILSYVEKSIKEKSGSIFDIEDRKNESVLNINISPIESEFILNGVIIVVTDVTIERKAEKIRRDFFANASHELKTPITSIQGFSELIASGIVTDKEKITKYTQTIKDESIRMSNIINDILTLSSLEESKEEEVGQDINLNNICLSVINSLSYISSKNNISINLTADKELTIKAKQKDMIMLFTNLIENGIKYNKENGRIDIRIKKEKNSVVIYVTDFGIGIPRGDIPRLFERFYRVDKGRSKKVSGTGLGLAIVKHIVTKYKGEILVNSVLGVGTTFKIKF